MNVIGQLVKHNSLGVGQIISCDESQVNVEFEKGLQTFLYPSAFGKYLTFVNKDLQIEIEELAKQNGSKNKVTEKRTISRFNDIPPVLNEKQSIFEVLTDEDYLISEYKINNRKGNAPHENEIHVMFPGKRKHIIKIYANDWGIGFVVNHSFENFKSSVKCERIAKKPDNPNTEYSFRIYLHKNGITDVNTLYDTAVTVAMEIMGYAIELNPDYDPNNMWEY